ncbi:hypothetical protein DJ021_03995 [Phenylobacterium hankyongense]|uniref:DUF5666 domain-containing protein n=1 Tax=Phenylobacterium hankyongense TaxID=1813876 RepID=A0A328AXM3_9CAUL|nr:hypothetical protein [Phenylobacterium hankyongense]RAK59025.1 hypothetical protein DJ021_03995 [Phenylobacterium hankyongense]
MTRPNPRLAAPGLLALALAAALPAAAQAPAGPTVVRGSVAALTDTTLTVKPERGGPAQVVTLAPTWTVAVMKPVAIDAIQPGSFIGTAEMPAKNGTGRSLEVHVFPPGVKMGEGHYGWDLKPGSMMTNGTVGKVMAGKRGSRELDVAYSYGTRHIVVPASVPVVQITGGQRSQVKPGVPVFMVVQKGPAGALTAGSVSIGENGAKPPM